jgi:hypothetical protein
MMGNSHFSDAELRNQLYEALQSQMFEQVSYEIHRAPHMTFMEACQAVRQAVDWYKVRLSLPQQPRGGGKQQVGVGGERGGWLVFSWRSVWETR